MRVLDLPTGWTILLDIVAWTVIHLGVVALTTSFPARRFEPRSWLFRPRRWEEGGAVYEKYFAVHRWKQWLPDAAGVLGRRGFAKRRLRATDTAHLEAFARETCRAEITHLLTMIWAPAFFLFNPAWVGWLMIGYATAENLPLIIAQRYNRFRIERILQARAALRLVRR